MKISPLPHIENSAESQDFNTIVKRAEEYEGHTDTKQVSLPVNNINNSPTGWLRALYTKALVHADSPKAFWIYILISFSESSFFLLPPDLLMIPMGVANRKSVWRLAFWGTISSVLGGVLGYFIGSILIDTVGQWIIKIYSLEESAKNFHEAYANWGFWIIVMKGATPIPYKLVTIASGMAHYPLLPFIGASVIARGFRFYLLAILLYFFGPQAKILLDRYLGWCVFASLIVVIGGFLIVKIFF